MGEIDRIGEREVTRVVRRNAKTLIRKVAIVEVGGKLNQRVKMGVSQVTKNARKEGDNKKHEVKRRKIKKIAQDLIAKPIGIIMDKERQRKHQKREKHSEPKKRR